jgi:peptidoglycan/LPS O-acetylase OafA/YrhL
LNHLSWFTGFGGAGVDLFFVLSGFILCYSHLTRDVEMSLKTYLEFLWLRLARVYPAYLMALLAIVMFVLTARHFGLPTTESHYPAGVLLSELFMLHLWTLQSWQNHQEYHLGWNGVDWTVSAEWFAYVFIFPIASLLLSWIKAVWMFLPLIALLLGGLTFSWFHEERHWSHSAVVQITLEFLTGAMFYGLRRQWNLPTTRTINLMLLLAVLTVVFLAADGQFLTPGLVISFGLAILALSYQRGRVSEFLSGRVMMYFGEISYSLYLTHQIVQRILKVLLHPDSFSGLSAFTRLIYFGIYLSAVIISAMAMFHLVEQPCRRYLRKISPFQKTVVSA